MSRATQETAAIRSKPLSSHCGCQPRSLSSGVLMAGRPSNQELRRKLADLEIEVREGTRVETDLNNELKKFRGLYDLAMAMMSGRSFDACLQSIVDKSRELLCSDISLLALHDEKRNMFYKHIWSGVQTETCRNLRLASDRGLGGLVAGKRQGCIVDEHLTDKSLDRKDVFSILLQHLKLTIRL